MQRGLTVPSSSLYIKNTCEDRVWPRCFLVFIACIPPPLTLPGVVDYSSVVLRIGFVVACLVGPILWGVIVNWLFTSWQERNVNRTSDEDDPVFPDYQI